MENNYSKLETDMNLLIKQKERLKEKFENRQIDYLTFRRTNQQLKKDIDFYNNILSVV